MKYKSHHFTTLLAKAQASSAGRERKESFTPSYSSWSGGYPPPSPSTTHTHTGFPLFPGRLLGESETKVQIFFFFNEWRKILIFLSSELKTQPHQSTYPLVVAQNDRQVTCLRAGDSLCPRLPDSGGNCAAHKGHRGSTTSYINKLHKWEPVM